VVRAGKDALVKVTIHPSSVNSKVPRAASAAIG
jgi:hypothetical protein